jgi:hypothetical protein
MNTFSAVELALPAFGDAVQLAVDAGLAAAAILDAKGTVLAVAGMLDDDEARAMAAHATKELRETPELFARVRDGQTIRLSLCERDVRVGLASSSVLFLVVLPRESAAVSGQVVAELRADIAHALERASTRLVPLQGTSGGSSSTPAELPVIEPGVTARRNDRN